MLATDFSYGFVTVYDINADQYLVSSSNMHKNLEPDYGFGQTSYWNPNAPDAVHPSRSGTLTYRFDFGGLPTRVFLESHLSTWRFDSNTYGVASLWGSTNGTSWESMLDLPAPSTDGAFGASYERDVPASLVGSSLWLQVRMSVKNNSSNVAQFSRSWNGNTDEVFRVFADFNQAPTGLSLSSTSIPENAAAGAAVGSFATTDPDGRDTFTYSFTPGVGDRDNARFTIVDGQLRTAGVLNYEFRDSYNIRVRSTDSGGLWTERQFTIAVADVPESPTLDTPASMSVLKDAAETTVNLTGITAGDPLLPVRVTAKSSDPALIPDPFVDYSSRAFLNASTISTGVQRAPGVAVGDFNGDGKMDLAANSATSGILRVAYGDGNGGFAAPITVSVGVEPYFVIADDFNKDGIDDVAVSNFESNVITVRLGSSSGAFGPERSFASGNGTWWPAWTGVWYLATGDFNGDGRRDIVSCNIRHDFVAVYLGDGDGGFGSPVKTGVWGATPTTEAQDGPYGVVVKDFNSDGEDDVAVAVMGENTIRLLLGNGAGVLTVASAVIVGPAPRGLTAADFDNDGRIDLVAANTGDGTLSLVRGNGAGGVLSTSTFAGGAGTIEVAASDLDRDGYVDLITSTSQGSVFRLRGRGDGTFANPEAFMLGPNNQTQTLSVIKDINGDRFSDIVSIGEVWNQIPADIDVLLSQPTTTGTLRFTPVAGKSGTATVSVTVEDGGPDGDLATPADNNSIARTFTVTVMDSDSAPTDITFSGGTVAEDSNVGMSIGTFSTSDTNTNDAFNYALVSGIGSTDNAAFTILGNSLRTAASFDFETKNAYSVRVRSTDQSGLFTEKVFTISVTNVNETPTGISLSASSIAENQPVRTAVGTITTTDTDSGDTFVYTLVSGAGDADNGLFEIFGNQLRSQISFDYEVKNAYFIRMRSTDSGGSWVEREFSISITDLNDRAQWRKQDGGNDHWYEVVLQPMTWENARAYALSAGGYLATVTSRAEQVFIQPLSTVTVWLGGYQNKSTATYSEPSGGWRWVTNEPWTYANWYPGEPSDSGTEDYLENYDFGNDVNGSWNDLGELTVRAFLIEYGNVNSAPAAVDMSVSNVPENQPVGTTVGTLSTIDPDLGDTFTYSLVGGDGSTDNASFTISGNLLRTAASFDFETKSSYSVRVRSTDQDGLFAEKTFTIVVTDINESSEFSYGFKHVNAPGADSYLIDSVGMKKYVENGLSPPITYWGPSANKTEGRLVYKFPFGSPSRSIRLRAHSLCSDFDDVEDGGSGRGASALQVSLDGTEWVSLHNGLEPSKQWGLDWTYNDVLPSSVLGGSELWVRLRFYVERAPNTSYTVAQFGRSSSAATGNVFQIDATLDANSAPTGVSLSNDSIVENAGANAVVGTLTTADADVGNTFTYTLVPGTGDADNAAFNLSGNQLRAAGSLDFETKNSYSIRVRTTDQGGLFFERAFEIKVTDVKNPIVYDIPFGQAATDLTTHSGDSQLVKRGAGVLILEKANSHSGGTVVEAGEVIIRNIAALGTGTLEVKATAKITLDVNDAIVPVGGLLLSSGGSLDVGYGGFTVAPGGYMLSTVLSLLRSGYAANWAGASGVVSQAAGAVAGGRLGYVVNPDDDSFTFGFAAAGDTNLDGTVDILDISAVAGKFGDGSSASWSDGDSNYDGVVDILDISELLSTALFNAGPYNIARATQAQSKLTMSGLSATDAAFLALATDASGSESTPAKKQRQLARR